MRKAGGRSDKWITVIGVVKLFKGLILLAIAVGALKLLHKDLADELNRWAQLFNVDPNSRLFQKVFSKIGGFDAHKLALLGVGTFFYSGLFLTEGVGLLLKKRWGEYLTVIVTASFLPLEIYELCKEFHAVRLILLIANAAIVVYLIWRLKTGQRKEK